MSRVYPFSAVVGQDEMKQALLAVAVDPTIGGVLILGHRGTGKSTAVRGLPRVLPPILRVVGCPYGCAPERSGRPCAHVNGRASRARKGPVPVVDLPLGATEDRVVGALDLERALNEGVKAFEPGLLAQAHRGFLYVDEVNLLEDHLVDVLLDVAASGENVVEREGLSVRHPARFVLVGSGNPEEGELRPQLLDRFGLAVEITTPTDLDERIQVIRRRDAFDRDPEGFSRRWAGQDGRLRARVGRARDHLHTVDVPEAAVRRASELCLALGTDGLRGELTLVRAARALAALEGDDAVDTRHLRDMAAPALRHRLRRDPLDETGSGARITRAMENVLGPEGA